MGSYGDIGLPQEDEITVLVTGFAPFRSQNPINPAWEIAKALPPFLPPSKCSADIAALASTPPVRILVHPEPLKVAYKSVRDIVPPLWDDNKVDFAIHIGMATGRKYYSVERRGHRDGYSIKDVDGSRLEDLEKRQEEGDDWIWHGLPENIVTDVDVDDVWKRWRIALPTRDVRVSEDAGRFLCDFIYYSSLAHLTRKEEQKRVVFFHVPVDASDEAIAAGTEIAMELIRAIVQSGRLKKLVS